MSPKMMTIIVGQNPQKRNIAIKGQATVAAIEPTDTYRLSSTSTANIASSKQAPAGPNVKNRHPTAVAMPFPPLNLSQGLNICPKMLAVKASAKGIPESATATHTPESQPEGPSRNPV